MDHSMNFQETEKFIEINQQSGCSVVPLLEGHTGIGKTDLVTQYAFSRNMDLIILHVAQLEPSEFIGLYKINEDNRTDNCPPSFLPYKEYKVSKNVTISSPFPVGQGFINPNGGILFLDEVNRGHEDIRQCMYQLVNAKKIHTYELPHNYHLIAAANPQGYEVYEFDAALKNRFAWINFVPEFEETINYLQNKYGDSPVISWLKTDKSLLDYSGTQDKALTPRIADNAIKLFQHMQELSPKIIRKFLATILQDEKVQSFLSYLKELKNINFKEILEGKKMQELKLLIKNHKMDVLSTLSNHLAEYVNELDGKVNKKELKNIIEFLIVTPADLNMSFVDTLKKELSDFDNPKSFVNFPLFRDKIGKEKLMSLMENHSK